MSLAFPDFDTFQRLAASGHGTVIPVYRRLLSDQLTPVLAYRRLVRQDERMAPSYLFESVIGGDRIGRYSYLGSQPIAELIARGYEVEYRDRRENSASRSFHCDDPLGEMNKLTSSWHLRSLPELPPFTGGWVGFAGYDTVRYLESQKLADSPPDDRYLPDLHMQLYLDTVAFDHVQKTVIVITLVLIDGCQSVDQLYQAGQCRLDELVSRIETLETSGTQLSAGEVDLNAPPPSLPTSNLGDGGYQKIVSRCKRYIEAGDVFQVVPSQRFDVPTKADPFDIYRALRVINPSPYTFYIQIDGGMLVGSSPEILCRVHDGVVTNRPLAGTRRRGIDEVEDVALGQELLVDPKERAEHVMLVDLGRNDVGRVARPGTIQLPELLAIERYSHVMHLSSTVTGELTEGCTCWDALRCTLPVGTVSGAPKIRAMQIIDELEPAKRGPYAGAVGYSDLGGNMDMAIALRTMVIIPVVEGEKTQPTDNSTWIVSIQAGAGIVADSIPDNEHQETVSKAAAMAKAIDMAESAIGSRR